MVDIVTTTSSQTGARAPWEQQAPYLTAGFGRAQQLFNTPTQFYPESTVAPMGQATTNALNQIIGMGTNNQFLNPAANYYAQSVGGGFLPMQRMMVPGSSTVDGTYGLPPQPSNQLPAGWTRAPGAPTTPPNMTASTGGMPSTAPTTPQVQQMNTTNPYLDAMYAAAAAPATRQFTENVLPSLGAKFGMSGRSGSPGMMNAIQSAATGYGEGMGTLAANLYGQAYEQERQRQQQMAMFAPNLMNAQLGLAGAGVEAGQTFDEQAQRQLNDQIARFQFGQEEPWKRLERYMGAISGNYGGTTSQTTTQQQPVFEPELWQQILGGATALGGSGAFGEGGWLPGLLEGASDFAGNTWDWFTGLFD